MKDYCLKQIIIFYEGRILTRSGIAAGAEFYDCQSGTAAWLCFLMSSKPLFGFIRRAELLGIVALADVSMFQCLAPLVAILLVHAVFLREFDVAYVLKMSSVNKKSPVCFYM